MTVTLFKKLQTLCLAYRETCRLPNLKHRLMHLLNPLDSVRYTEFTFLLEFLRNSNKVRSILDVSSPHLLAYILSRDNDVVKTNIDVDERRHIRENPALKFLVEDALRLSFRDDTFDLVYSISVIEHIYAEYKAAVLEFVRVAKKGGYVYLTFPVSSAHVEEWLDFPIYPAQKRTDKGFFFQYRFTEAEVDALVESLAEVEVVSKAIYWERVSGGYDRLMAVLKWGTGNQYADVAKNALLNFYAGLFLLEQCPHGGESGRTFGNVSIILRKKG